MPTDPAPSYEQLAALVLAQANTIIRLEAEVAELKRQLGQNPRNSSKPPSSEGLSKPAPKSLRGKSGRKPGGQPGHPGSTLALIDGLPGDRITVHEPVGCRGCGASLAGAERVGVERRQVFDLPVLDIEVYEHQLVARRCRCGVATCADAPAGVAATVQYGPRATATVLYLYAGQFLSKARTAQALSELFSLPLSHGTVSAMTARCAGRLDEFMTGVKFWIAQSPVVGFDETGFRVENALHWVHCARTEKYTLLHCDRKRGRVGIDATGVLPGFTGVAVHDAWAPYDTYGDAAHQLCTAHVQRELVAVLDIDPADDNGWHWAKQIYDALVAMQKLADTARAAGTAIDADALADQTHLYLVAARIGKSRNAARVGKAQQARHALATRLFDRRADYLRFTTDLAVPPDNNGSERDIRMVKLRQKVSGTHRTLAGANYFCRLRSYLATAAKHGVRFIDALVALAEGDPWMPEFA